MVERDVLIGNTTTIIMFLFSAVGGGAIVDVLGGTSQATIIIGMIVGLAYSIINAYYPNFFKFLNNHERDIESIACVCDGECKDKEEDNEC